MGNKSEWHLHKAIPVGVILALIVEAISFFTFTIRMDSRITSLEKKSIERDVKDEKQDENFEKIIDRLNQLNIDTTRIKTILEYSDIERQLQSSVFDN